MSKQIFGAAFGPQADPLASGWITPKGNEEMLLAYERFAGGQQEPGTGKLSLFLGCVAAGRWACASTTTSRGGGRNSVAASTALCPHSTGRRCPLDPGGFPTKSWLALGSARPCLRWITPCADGLNLCGKEYVAARPGRDGVLRCSPEFTGASVELQGAVLAQTPTPTASIWTGPIAEALVMPKPDQPCERMVIDES